MRKQTAWTLVLLALLAVFPGRARARPGLLYFLRAPRADLRAGRHQPEPDPGLRRHGGAGPRGLLRRRRLCGGHPGHVGRDVRAGVLAGGRGAGGRAGLHHRRDLAAHARRVLHHDHAGLRADAVLHLYFAAAVWRRGRAEPAGSVHAAGAVAGRRRVVLLPGAGAVHAPVLAVRTAGGLPLRHRAARHTRERVAHGVSGLSGLSNQAGRLHAERRRGRTGRRAAGQPQPVHLAQPDALDPVGQPADHGAGGRHRPAPWRRGRRGGDADAGRGSALVDGILAPAAGRAVAGRGVRRAARAGRPAGAMVRRPRDGAAGQEGSR